MKKQASADCLGLVESLYAFESDEAAWLSSVARSACDVLGIPHKGGYALRYDASDVADCRFPGLAITAEVSPEAEDLLRGGLPNMYRQNPPLVEAVFRRVGHGLSRNLPLGEHGPAAHAALAACGVSEIFGINGINLDGRGLHVGILVGANVSPPPTELLDRLASHLAAASRLRRRLGRKVDPDGADAVLEPNGALAHVHAESAATVGPARRDLERAVLRLESARAAVRKRDPELALSHWTALVDARWSLVDHFESDGKRYIVAERNDLEPAPMELLTRRERQVVALAAIGHANKMIAYELGIAVSTASVLLSRARQKVGVRTRRELVELYRGQPEGRLPA